jgi:hypothetical protein
MYLIYIYIFLNRLLQGVRVDTKSVCGRAPSSLCQKVSHFVATEFKFQVNFVSPEPSTSGQFYVLLNPVGNAPEHDRLDGVTSVTWILWLSESKAAEYRQLVDQAKAHKSPHKLFVTAQWDVRVKPGFKPGQQSNRLSFVTKAVKEIAPVEATPTQDELA